MLRDEVAGMNRVTITVPSRDPSEAKGDNFV